MIDAVARRRNTARSTAVLRRAGLAVLVLTSLATAWMLIADNLPGSYALGIAQRIQVTGMSLYLLVLGWSVRYPATRTNN